IGERESVSRVEMILVLLAARNHRIGEALIEPFAPGAGDMRKDAVEYLASAGVGVEPAINEIADAAPGLRAAPGVGPVDRPDLHGIFARVAQKADEIADRRMPQTEHQRIAAGVDQLVNPARLEPSRDMDIRVGRDERLLGALVIKAGPAFAPCEAP